MLSQFIEICRVLQRYTGAKQLTGPLTTETREDMNSFSLRLDWVCDLSKGKNKEIHTTAAT